MAKTKAESQSGKKQKKPAQKSAEELYALTIEAIETADLEIALEHAQTLLSVVDPDLAGTTSISEVIPKRPALPALNLLGEISVELGDIENARRYFLLAVKADPDGSVPDDAGGGAEKFLWLAQLSDDGGADSVTWFEKGVRTLKTQIEALENDTKMGAEEKEILINEKSGKVATALCSVVEVYMTDLSWEEDAETRCENLMTEALLYAPESPEVLQTLASVRLSQLKLEDAQSALTRSVAIWKDLDEEDDLIPDYPTRVSLSRLLMEAEMEEQAMIVLERLALEDDESVEACYLGGWCLHLLADKRKNAGANGSSTKDDEDRIDTLKASRKWLLNALKLYELQDYEDDRLRDHANELVKELEGILGPVPEDADADEEFEEWLDEEDSEGEDEQMEGA
ncbi:hypothetical protein MBLNU457_5642t1 [Dothideomycetes sp. NU457]